MKPHGCTKSLRGWFRSWRRDRRGNAAIETALIVPILAMMLIGMTEAIDLMMADRKVTSVTSSTADLVARVREIDSDGLSDVFSAAQTILDPYPTAGRLSIKVTSLTMDSYNNVRVHWSAATAGTSAYTAGASYTKSVPTGVLAANESVILAEIEYLYPGPSTDFILGPKTISESYYAKPRRSRTVMRCNDLTLSSPSCY
jgi:Flp pilus assembly protein TadG